MLTLIRLAIPQLIAPPRDISPCWVLVPFLGRPRNNPPYLAHQLRLNIVLLPPFLLSYNDYNTFSKISVLITHSQSRYIVIVNPLFTSQKIPSFMNVQSMSRLTATSSKRRLKVVLLHHPSWLP